MTELLKLMSDETRLRIFMMLYHQDLCVCELVHLLQESQPKISKHIAKIRTLGYVLTSRNEQYIYYSLNRENPDLMAVLATIIDSVSKQEPYQNDLKRLQNMDHFVCGT